MDANVADNPLTAENQPPANDGQGQASPAVENSNLERIIHAGKSALGHLGIKKGRGRPRTDGLPKISDKVGEIPAKNKIENPPVVPAVDSQKDDAAFVAECIQAITEQIIDGALIGVRALGNAVTKDSAYVEKVVETCKPAEKKLAFHAKLTKVVAERHDLAIKYLPEAALICVTAGLVAPSGIAVLGFWKEKRKNDAEEAARTNQPKLTVVPKPDERL